MAVLTDDQVDAALPDLNGWKREEGALRRSVKIAWWPGHSTGRYAGSTWFTDAFALDLDRRIRLDRALRYALDIQY